MNVITILLTVIATVCLVLYLKFEKKTRKLIETENTLQVANEKIALYRYFVNDRPIKEFIKDINITKKEVLDADISSMLTKYLDKSLINLGPSDLLDLIRGVEFTEYWKIIINVLIQEPVKKNRYLPATMLSEAINSLQYEKMKIINEFLDLFPLEEKEQQISLAIYDTKNFLESEDNYERRAEIQKTLKKLQETIA